MNYKRIYDCLIEKGLSRILDENLYLEKHHIIPRCLAGSNKKSNIVKLTPEEHFVAHQLLVKIYPDNPSLVFAAFTMTFDSGGKRINNKLFGWIRRKLSAAAKTRSTGKSPSLETRLKLSKAMKNHKRTKEHCEKISKSKMGKLNPMSGKTHTKEAREKIGNASKGNTYASRKKET